MDKRNEKKNPEVRFKGFTEDWEYTPLGMLADLQNGYAFKSKFFQDLKSNLILLTPGNINIGGGFQYGKGHFYDALGEVPDRFIFKPEDIFLTMTDLTPTAQTLGFPALIPNDKNTYLHNQRLGKLINYDVDKNFLFQLLCTPKFQKQIVLTSSGTTVKHTSPNKILTTNINFPKDKTEQKQIGSFFQNLDNLITLHQKKYDKLIILKKAMLVKMFPKNGAVVPEIRFKGFTEDWEEKRLGEIGQTYTGLSGKTKVDFGHGKGRFVTYMNVFNNPISNLKITDVIEIDNSQNEVNYGDVFFTTSSETPEEVGMSSVWLSNEKNIYLNSFCFGYRLSEKIDSYFLSNLLRSTNFRTKISFLAQGISRYNISKNRVMEILIEIPSYNEQIKIGEYFKNLNSQIALHQTQLKKLKNIKKACFSKMFVAQD
ncbi:restriction endonuclease subunit S [Flavobacterium xanthum]|uniref:Type I restriction enzyme, S subunit n=1 Tax=Flavobacterium xanthum TaxID=69322 RepID=A0A1M7IUL3_9FLAO|nr:restriction endonuclease subunit S [Flavobacterium xanthum]SHM44436.1 type I restriction enzyme, S subunit [Flavobacterium xanthum]